MKFTAKRSDIIDVLAKVQGITGKRSNLAITENVLIKSTDSGISIAATDLETGFEGKYPAVIETDGVIAINSKKLFEIVKNFPSDDILINEMDNKWFKIGNNKVQYNIVGMNPDDFPDIPKIEDINYFEIEAYDFRKMIEETVMIGHTLDEKRPHILGVNFECIDNENELIIRMVSTDGKRLSMANYLYMKQKISLLPGEKIIIPKKGLSDAGKFLDKEGIALIGVKDNHFIIKKDNETIIMNLLEGVFPDFSNILHIDNTRNTVELDKESFKMMLKRMSILTSEDYKGVYFKFGDNRFEITTTNPDIGESNEDIEVDYNKGNMEIAFNPHFFIDALNFIDGEKVSLNFIDDEHPCLLYGENYKTLLNVIMPMKI